MQQISSLNADAVFTPRIADITCLLTSTEFIIAPKAVLNYCVVPGYPVVVNLRRRLLCGGAAFLGGKAGYMPELAAINAMYKAKTSADLDGPA